MIQYFTSDFELYHPDSKLAGPATWPESCETSVHDLFDDETHSMTVQYVRKRNSDSFLQTCIIKWENTYDGWIVFVDPGDNYLMPVKKKSSKNKIRDELFDTDTDEKFMCKVCFTNKVTHCFDCGHIVCCHCCTILIQKGNDARCPTCRVRIKYPRRIYFT